MEFEKILYDPVIGKFVTAFVLTLIIISISRFIRSRITRVTKDIDLRYRLRKIVTVASYLIVIFVLSIVFSDKLGGLTVALGVAGAGIAFALQEVIASIAGWLAVSLSNFYRVGDRVQLGGNVGDVIDIGILRTTLMECRQWVDGDQYTGRIVRVANSFVFKDSVINYSADFPFLWDEIKLPVRYGSDVELTRNIINQAANEIIGPYVPQAQQHWDRMLDKYRIENANVHPMIFMVANDNWLEFSLRYVVDYQARRTTKDKLFTKIYSEILKTDNKVQLASATFELTAVPPFNISLNKS
ncbi:mechanosensitive ion channel family protein [Melioribacter sp. Ez-97]|uniref:mechanosensitive ion channel family protein n=1 Tax=Melioribacter sp. Ez-97 TaxID=3423434 RepID=UPI003ED9BACD